MGVEGVPSETDETTRKWTAWQAGCSWNRLRHAAVVALITGEQDAIGAVEDAAHDLSIVVRSLVVGVRAQDDLTDAVRLIGTSIVSYLNSESYGEEWCQVNENLGAPYLASQDECRDIVGDLTGYFERVLEQLQQRLEQVLDEAELRFFRLAIFADQGLRSREVFDDLAPVGGEPYLDEHSTLSEQPSEPQAAPRRCRRLPAGLKTNFGDPPLTSAWRQEMETRWKEAGQPEDVLPWRTELNPSSSQTARETVAAVHQVAARLLGPPPQKDQPGDTQEVGDGQRQPSDPDKKPELPPEVPAGYLGLQLDQSRQTVTRAGFKDPITLRSRLLFKVLALLVQKADRFTTLQNLKDEWDSLGGNEKSPVRGSIDNYLSKLRPLISPLGIDIENVKKTGWRLVAFATDDRRQSGR